MTILPIQTADFWDGAADQYMVAAEPFTGQFCEDAAELARISPGLSVLDIATGPGAFALAAARRGGRVTAIDFSQAMVDRLANRIGDLSITARRMDGQALDLPDAMFDRAASVFGIPLFPDWRAGLREMARVLRPDGRAVLAAAGNPYGFGPNLVLAKARADVTGVPAPVEIAAWGILADPVLLKSEMQAAGFANVEIHERTHDFRIDPALLVAGHPMIQRNPILAGLSDAERDAVIAAAIAAVAADARRHPDGIELRLPGVARLAVGVKATGAGP